METALDKVREGKLAFSQELASVVLLSRDHILCLLGETEAPPRLIEASETLIRKLRAFTGQTGGETCPPASPAPARKPVARPSFTAAMATWWIRYRPHPDTFLTGTDPLSLLRELADMNCN